MELWLGLGNNDERCHAVWLWVAHLSRNKEELRLLLLVLVGLRGKGTFVEGLVSKATCCERDLLVDLAIGKRHKLGGNAWVQRC